MIKEYIIRVRVCTDALRQSRDGNMESVSDAIEAEMSWVGDSGIEVLNIEEVLDVPTTKN